MEIQIFVESQIFFFFVLGSTLLPNMVGNLNGQIKGWQESFILLS